MDDNNSVTHLPCFPLLSKHRNKTKRLAVPRDTLALEKKTTTACSIYTDANAEDENAEDENAGDENVWGRRELGAGEEIETKVRRRKKRGEENRRINFVRKNARRLKLATA